MIHVAEGLALSHLPEAEPPWPVTLFSHYLVPPLTGLIHILFILGLKEGDGRVLTTCKKSNAVKRMVCMITGTQGMSTHNLQPLI
jgi:hypothetical protein